MQQKQPPVIPFTKEGYEEIKREYNHLIEERKEAVTQLQKAREMGDLSENGFYKAVKAKLSSIDHNINRLKYLIRYGKVRQTTSTGIIDIGHTVVIDDGNQQRSFTLVGGHESNPTEGKISHISPLGKALLGKKVRDEIRVTTPRGEIRYKILQIT